MNPLIAEQTVFPARVIFKGESVSFRKAAGVTSIIMFAEFTALLISPVRKSFSGLKSTALRYF